MSRPGNDIDEDRKLSRFLTMETEAERMKRELKEEGATKSTFWRIVKETRPEWPLLIPCLIMNAVYGLVMPAFTLIYNYLFEIFKLTDLEELKQKSIFASLLFVGLGFFGAIIMLVSITMYGLLMESVTKRMRLKTFVNLVKQDVAFFDLPQHGTGKLCMRLATDAPNVKNALDWRLGTCAEAFMSVVLGMVLAIVFGWKLAVPLVFLSPLLFLGMFLEVYIREKTVDSDVKLMEEAGKVSSEAIQNVRTVQALVKQDTFYDMYCGHLDEPFKHLKRQGLVHALALGYANSIGYFFYAAGVALGALFVGFGWFSPLVVFKVVFLIQFSTFSVGFAASFFPEFYKARMSAGLIFKLCDIKPKIDSFSTEGSRPTLEGEINFSHVSFSYDLRPTFKVLRELNFNLEKGKSLALVGPSGCGKSTVVSLLLRFYDSNEGVIRLDGYGIRTLNVTHLRREQAVVAQEPVLFNTSIMHNIIYGLEETVSEAEMLPLAEKCAKQANIHEFIVGLPEGYNTSVGNRGTQLSGGQRQRIAIARALAREPTVLLLDEATSALDTEAEKVVQAALDAASAGRTCITIAHRLSTIVNADHIAVVRNGAIVEYGTHESLMAENGLYNQMVQHQNLLEANKPRDSDV